MSAPARPSDAAAFNLAKALDARNRRDPARAAQLRACLRLAASELDERERLFWERLCAFGDADGDAVGSAGLSWILAGTGSAGLLPEGAACRRLARAEAMSQCWNATVRACGYRRSSKLPGNVGFSRADIALERDADTPPLPRLASKAAFAALAARAPWRGKPFKIVSAAAGAAAGLWTLSLDASPFLACACAIAADWAVSALWVAASAIGSWRRPDGGSLIHAALESTYPEGLAALDASAWASVRSQASADGPFEEASIAMASAWTGAKSSPDRTPLEAFGALLRSSVDASLDPQYLAALEERLAIEAACPEASAPSSNRSLAL